MKVKKYTLRRTAPAALERHIWDDELDDEQRAVVLAPPGHLLVVAGAGAGKTRALTHRVAHLIQQGTLPERIMLCTFTNRAAREMLRRVEELASVDKSRLWAGTFHHVGNRLLRTYGEDLGRPAGFAIMDRSDSVDLISRVVAETSAGSLRRFPQANVLATMISLATNTGRELGDLLEGDFRRFSHHRAAIEAAAEAYAERKRRLGLMDFDDLLTGWLEALRDHPAVAAQIQERFRHVLVDEYQDVNHLQAQITDLMALGHGSLTVVGDDDQSIYSFRGADARAMLGFLDRHPTATVLRIQTNYRSTPEILRLASRSVAHNRLRHAKTLRPSRPQGELPVVVATDDAAQQAAFVAQRVLELHQDEGLALSDMAVLMRANSHSLELQVELTHRQIPFIVRAGTRLLEQAHIKDALAHLRWHVNPSDELAATRVLRLLPGVGATTASRIISHVSQRRTELHLALGSALQQKVVAGRGSAALRELMALFGRLSSDESGPAGDLRAVAAGPYRELALAKFSNAAERLEDLAQLADHAERYDSTSRFLNDLALMAGVAAEGLRPGEAPDDCLTLSTIHQAKGLEWKAVFILWLCEGHFPSALALRDPAGEEEERRLFHVAATRAADRLTMVYPMFAEHRGLPRVITRPSRFILELEPEPPFERWRIELE